ncbi:MAG: replication initiation protein [Bacteroides xylanisolvens]
MTSDKKIQLEKQRNYLVVKANSIVQKSRYELSVPEQRAIAYICSLIKPIGEKGKYILDYEFNIAEYTKVCGISSSGSIYDDTKALLKGLITKVNWITLDDGTETTVNWVQKVWTNKRNGKAKIRLDEDMVPYLFDLQERFFSYGLYNVLAMKSQFSTRLYELLKSYAFQSEWTFELDHLKKLLMVDDVKSYKDFSLFRARVLEQAQEEINELTDISISFKPILKGRKTIKVQFKITSKTPLERSISEAIVHEKLTKNVMDNYECE